MQSMKDDRKSATDDLNAGNEQQKSNIRRQLRETLAQFTEPQRHAKSDAACALIIASPEFAAPASSWFI